MFSTLKLARWHVLAAGVAIGIMIMGARSGGSTAPFLVGLGLFVLALALFQITRIRGVRLSASATTTGQVVVGVFFVALGGAMIGFFVTGGARATVRPIIEVLIGIVLTGFGCAVIARAISFRRRLR